MPPPASNYIGTTLGEHGSDWSRDLATLTFDLGSLAACDWCGSSSCIRKPSLKFVGLAIRKIWRTICVSINGPGDPDLWPFDLETCESHLRWGTFTLNLGTLGLGVFELCAMYATDGQQTDRQTDWQKQRLLPLPYGGGGIINGYKFVRRTVSTVIYISWCSHDVNWTRRSSTSVSVRWLQATTTTQLNVQLSTRLVSAAHSMADSSLGPSMSSM